MLHQFQLLVLIILIISMLVISLTKRTWKESITKSFLKKLTIYGYILTGLAITIIIGLFWNFKYPKEIRRIIYTTNIIESFHSQLRKVTKSKRVFSSDMSLLKLLFLVQGNIKEDWEYPMFGWKLTHAQMMILFEERMTQH